MKRLLLVSAALALLAGGAKASIIPTLVSVVPTGPNYDYTYAAALASDAGVVPGDELVIQDFAGFQGFGALPADIVGSTELTTDFIPAPGAKLVMPPGFTDDPTIPNIVFTYVGPPFHNKNGPFPEVDFTLSALSKYKTFHNDGFSAITIKNSGPSQGTPIYDVGATSVPTAIVPEPAGWALMILGLGGAGALVRRKRAALA